MTAKYYGEYGRELKDSGYCDERQPKHLGEIEKSVAINVALLEEIEQQAKQTEETNVALEAIATLLQKLSKQQSLTNKALNALVKQGEQEEKDRGTAELFKVVHATPVAVADGHAQWLQLLQASKDGDDAARTVYGSLY